MTHGVPFVFARQPYDQKSIVHTRPMVASKTEHKPDTYLTNGLLCSLYHRSASNTV